MKRLIMAVFLLISGTTAAIATDVCGSISGVWTLAGSPYMVNCDVTVATGQTLEIQPGVQVLFTGHYKFIVNGNLQAIGTEQDSIRFTSQDSTGPSAGWGVRFINASNASRMEYCVVQYQFGTGDAFDDRGGGLHFNNCSPNMFHSSIRQNRSQVHGGGVHCYGGAAPTFVYCDIINNTVIGYQGGGVFCDNASPSFDHCVIARNANPGSGGAVFFDHSFSELTNCTISQNTSGGNGQLTVAYTSIPGFNSCIVSNGNNSGVHYYSETPPSSSIRYCDVYGNSAGNFAGAVPLGVGSPSTVNANGDSCDVSQNIQLNPMFDAEGVPSYQLLAESPCIDAGDPSLPLDSDGTIADMGAFPYLRRLTILAPNGGESWRIQMADTVLWSTGIGAAEVRIELNRDYPAGTWEVLAENTPNDGAEAFDVTGPPSAQCRIRVSAVNDTMNDISDADFSIINHVTVTSPNGGEDWTLWDSAAVQWVGTGFTGNVMIELNRNYPGGPWDTLAYDTPNDGAEMIFVTEAISNTCRVRVSAIEDMYSDVSDGNFSIMPSQGYLALVRESQPSTAVLNWNAGIVECPQTPMETFHLKNFGSASITVYRAENVTNPAFSRITNCPLTFTLAAGEMTTCEITLSFAPDSDGTYRDTLRIRTNASNATGLYVRIPLAATQIRTPATPQIVITVSGEDAVLHWNAITESVGGCPVNVTRYLVFYAPTSGGPYYYHGWTADTTYTHYGVISYASGMYYQAVCVAGSVDLSRLVEGMTREEAMQAMNDER